MNDIKFRINTSTVEHIKKHLIECSPHFAPVLATYVDIEEYSDKIFNKAVKFEAFDNNKLIGLVAVYIDLNRKIGFITDVSVNIEYKGHGIASNLIKQVKSHALRNNIETLALEVYHENIKAINFYNKHGFTTYGSTTKTSFMQYELGRDYNKEFQDIVYYLISYSQNQRYGYSHVNHWKTNTNLKKSKT
jgi:ribosomal-protein-alanine N-acetyltransferase